MSLGLPSQRITSSLAGPQPHAQGVQRPLVDAVDLEQVEGEQHCLADSARA
jgi:hypothetical protein